jgi:hypothetical protein
VNLLLIAYLLIQDIRYIITLREVFAITRISDVIDQDEIASWKPGGIILITAPTGSGKSHFVKNSLRGYLEGIGQKCLYLLPRIFTRDQFQEELPEDDVIDFRTYQSLEQTIKSSSLDGLSYGFIVCDESHYFISDAKFNSYTDLSLDWVISQDKAVRIFMSATHGGFKKYLGEIGVGFNEYLFSGGCSNIRSLSFFYGDRHLEKIADKIIESGSRGIFFIQSAKRAHRLYEKYKGKAAFICSRYNEDYAKYIDDDAVESLLEAEKFECSLVFATTALDTGFNIKDETLKTVVIDVVDPTALLQCLGRKRFIDENDIIDLYVRTYTRKQINGYVKAYRDVIDIVKQFLKDPEKYNMDNQRRNDASGLIIDVPCGEPGKFEKKVHVLKYALTRYALEIFLAILKLGYAVYIGKLVGKEYAILEDEQETQSLGQYLESIVGIQMYTPEDKDKFIEKMHIRKDRKLCKGYETLSGWLKDSRLPYKLETSSVNIANMVDGNKQRFKHVWTIVRV